MSSWDHPAHPGCYIVVRQLHGGQVCVICYHHVLSYSFVRVKREDVPVCQSCGNALGKNFTSPIVRALMDCMLRRLILDSALARSRQMLDNYDIDEETVVH